MTTMQWGNSSGTMGRCDAKCHGAILPTCQCMCGGRYHGSALQPGGVKQAVSDFGVEVLEQAESPTRVAGTAADGLQMGRSELAVLLRREPLGYWRIGVMSLATR